MESAEHDAVQVVGEPLRIGGLVELALGDPGPEDLRDDVGEVLVVGDQLVPDRARLVVELGGGRDEKAAGGDIDAVYPILEEGPQSGLSPGARSAGRTTSALKASRA
ncbi:hypothetical protein GCM10027615_44910 [Plantactinospora veratri]